MMGEKVMPVPPFFLRQLAIPGQGINSRKIEE